MHLLRFFINIIIIISATRPFFKKNQKRKGYPLYNFFVQKNLIIHLHSLLNICL